MMRILGLALLAAGCEGVSEARRSAAQLAEATDGYVQQVGARMDAEQRAYEQARWELDGGQDRLRRTREAARPSLGSIERVERLIASDEPMRRPAEFYDALLQENARREEEARARAADRAALRRAYAANLADLELKRSELQHLRTTFESLIKELSLVARIAYIERLAIHARSALRRPKP
jgi:hypothetical protein